MKRLFGLAAGALLALATAAYAQAPTPAPAPTLQYLTPADVDPMLLLPPPVGTGSPTHMAEVAEVLQIQKTATAERRAQAVWDDRHESAEAFEPTLGPSFKLSALPATAKLMMSVQLERDVATNMAKVYFDRPRPWTFNDAIEVCEEAGRNGAQRRSYPSGHGTLGFAQGIVLASLMPEKAQVILARSADYAFSRVVCGVHYRSDTVASQALGTTIGVLLLRNPALKPQIDAARAELRAAGLTQK